MLGAPLLGKLPGAPQRLPPLCAKLWRRRKSLALALRHVHPSLSQA
jgi:hypothetical protein